jgi:transcriptional repressor NrdR
MQCPNCGGTTSILETRQAGKHELRRRRTCEVCKLRFSTREQIAAPQLRVEKRRGGVEPYDRGKLARCLERVCARRPLEQDAVAAMVERIEAAMTRTQQRTLRWSQLAAAALEELRAADRLAAQRLEINYLDEAGVLRLADSDGPRPGPSPQLDLFDD